MTQKRLGAEAGISKRTLFMVLSGEADYKITTLMAVLDRLDLELAIVPKAAAAALDGTIVPAKPAVKTRVQAALERSSKLDDTH